MVGGALTYNDLQLDLRRALLPLSGRAASLEARELLMAASGKTREELMLDARLYVSEDARRRADELLKRRLSGEPVAYITGVWEFYGLELMITPDVLIPRVDTEVLAAAAISWLNAGSSASRVLDLCCGSGCVGLAIMRNTASCNVVFCDKSAEALRIASLNARKNLLSARSLFREADVVQGAPSVLGRFDLAVCNPPYIKTREISALDGSVRLFEPRMALDGGEDGLCFYRAAAELWKNALRPGGVIMFECGSGMAVSVAAILEENGFAEIDFIRDLEHIDRVVRGTYRGD